MIKRILTALPGVGAALLPKAACPACWPVYAGILSSVGLGFLMTGPYFYLLIGLLLSVSLLSLAHKAKTRRGYLPFGMGLIGTVVIIVGKYYSLSDYVFYVGAFLMIMASLWNNLPTKSGGPSVREEPIANGLDNSTS